MLFRSPNGTASGPASPQSHCALDAVGAFGEGDRCIGQPYVEEVGTDSGAVALRPPLLPCPISMYISNAKKKEATVETSAFHDLL